MQGPSRTHWATPLASWHAHPFAERPDDTLEEELQNRPVTDDNVRLNRHARHEAEVGGQVTQVQCVESNARPVERAFILRIECVVIARCVLTDRPNSSACRSV